MNILKKFLNEHKTEGNDYTHTSMKGGKWRIPEERMEEFYSKYSKALVSGAELYMTERHKEYCPIVIDLDIEYDEGITERQITDTIVDELEKKITCVIKRYIKGGDYTCYILQRPNIRETSRGTYKDGIHIMYPYIVTKPEMQHVLRKNSMSQLEPIMGKIHNKTPIKSVYDESVIERNNWCMYGSTKESIKPYEITYIYNSNEEEIKEDLKNYEITYENVRIMSIRNKVKESEYRKLYSEIISEYKTINKYERKRCPKEEYVEELNNRKLPEEKMEVQECGGISVKELLCMLSYDRVRNYYSWLEVGFALHNISQTMKQEWKEWSEKCVEKYSSEECERQWSRMRSSSEGGYTIRSLHYWAQQDNPLEYKRMNMRRRLSENEIMNILYRYDIIEETEWKKQGSLIKNSKMSIKTWEKLSEGYYEERECEMEWESLPVGEDIWLHYDNLSEKEKEENKRKSKYSELIKQNTKNFPKNKMEVGRIILRQTMATAEILDKYCPMAECDHEGQNLYTKLQEMGLTLNCRKCVGKKSPREGHITVSPREINIILNCTINNINKTTNNNYITLENKEDIDNENLFNIKDFEIMGDNILINLMHESMTQSAYRVASVLYYKTKNKYACGEYTEKWYNYNGTRWRANDYTIRNMITKEMVGMYKMVLGNLKITEKVGSEKYTKKRVQINSLISKLETTMYINSVLTEAKIIFKTENPEFESKLDKKIYLLGFNDGVYDLKMGKFRKGTPQDYITKSVGYEYPMKSEPEKREKIMKMLREIIPNENVRNYVLKFLSYCLSGDIRHQKVHFFSGEGSNGKSLLLELMRKVMGEYSTTIPITILVQKRPNADNANPHMYKAINSRLTIFNEPDMDDEINSGIIKELSGGEKIVARGLYKDPVEFLPQFKMVILCNVLPKLHKQSGYAEWRRLCNIKFESKFVDIPDPENGNEYKKDESLSNNFEEWKGEFMLILLEYYNKYQNEGLTEISEIQAFTNEYKENNNPYKEFIESCLEKTDNENDGISQQKVCALYNMWIKHNANKKYPQEKIMKKYMEDNIFKSKAKTIRTKDGVMYGWKYHKEKEFND